MCLHLPLFFCFAVRINDTVTFVEDGLDEDIEFGDEISTDGEGDPVDNVSNETVETLVLCIFLMLSFNFDSFVLNQI